MLYPINMFLNSLTGNYINLIKNSSFGFLIESKIGYSIFIIISFIILAYIIKFIFHKILPLFTKHTKNEIDDLIFKKTKNPLFYIILLIGIYASLSVLDLPNKLGWTINKLILTFCIILGSIIFIRLIEILIDFWGKIWAKKTKSTLDDDLLPLFHKASKIIFILFCSILIVRAWGFNVTSLLAGVGIAGMVLGLALKDTLANIFGGISIILDKNMKVGDKVKIDNDTGIIEDIGLRSSKLRTYDNELIIIPNNQLANTKIMNYVQPNSFHRAVVKFGVEYGNDIDKVKKIVIDAVQKIPDAIYDDKDKKPLVVFNEMGDSSLNFSTLIWSTHDKSWNVKLEATNKIYNALKKAKIGIAFPTRTVYLKKK